MITNLKYSSIAMESNLLQETLVVNDLDFCSHSINQKNFNKMQIPYRSYSDNVSIPDQFMSSVLNDSKKQTSLNSNLLPPAIKYSYPGLAVFERPPTYQIIQYIPTSAYEITDNHEPQIYRIPIPWQLYIISYDPVNFYCTSVKMFFMQSSLFSADQTLFMPPIPNFFTNGGLCRPMYEGMEDIERYSKDLSGVIASAYDWIWNSGFNHDLSENISHLRTQNKPVEITSDKEVSESSNFHGSHRHVTAVYLHRVFKAWEKIDINNILNLVWPNPSLSQSFEGDPSYYCSYDPDRFDINCEEEECSEDSCRCFPELMNETQTFNTVMTATLHLDYHNALLYNRNLDKIFSTAFKLINC